MKLGVIARSEDRGLGLQTWEVCRHLQPDRVLLVEPVTKRWRTHPERYEAHDTTNITWDGTLDEPTVRRWASGLDVIYTVETLYDWRLPTWTTARVVCHANPEMLRPDLAHTDVVWWAPTPWRLEHLPPVTVVPQPVATDRFAPQSRLPGPIRFLHVVGHQAMCDRNGTRLVAAAAHHVGVDCELVFTSQDRNIRARRTRPPVKVRFMEPVAEYWRLYDQMDVLVMPRRYGGLCLPVGEAMAAGLPVVLTDCPPNDIWPGPKVRVESTQDTHMAGGTVTLHNADTRDLASVMRALCSPGALGPPRAEAARWVAENSWEALRPRWLAELDRVSPSSSRGGRAARTVRPHGDGAPAGGVTVIPTGS